MISASSTIELDVEKSGNFRTSEFRIKNSAKMFKILSSGLYKNKIRAILREFGMNCWDSHVVNGNKDEPFLVKLPNSLDPTLTLRDYGTGLTEKEIREIYTTYGESTKDTSNDVGGSFGLGAKSIFSYTDSATLNSYKDGVKTAYSLHVNAHGIPECARLTGVTTKERNGVEIIIPVQRSDFDQFRREAELVFTFFKPKPKVIGNSSYRENTITEAPFMEEKDSWATYNTTNGLRLFDESRAILVMSGTAYPIDLNAVGANIYNHWLFSSSYVVVHVDIGDVDITISRESLEYVPQTINTIKKKIAQIEASYQKKLEAEIAKQDCYYNACLYYNKQPLQLTATYKGKPLKTYIDNPLYEENKKAGVYDVYQFSSGAKKPNPHTNIERFYVGSDDRYRFYLEDDDKKVYTKVQLDLNASGYGKTGVLLKTQDKAKIKRFLDEVGLLDKHLIRTSTLPDPPKQVRNKQTKVGGYCLLEQTANYYHRDNMTYAWKRLEDIPPKSIVVGFDQFYVIDAQGGKIRPQEFRKSVANLPACFKIDANAIYGLSREKFKKASSKGFVDFWTQFNAALDAELKKNKAQYEELLEYEAIANNQDKFPNVDDFFLNIDKLCPLSPPALLDKIKKIHISSVKLRSNGDTQKFLDLITQYRKDAIKSSNVLGPLVEEVYKKAPLLYSVSWEKPYYNKKAPDPIEGISQYLKLVL